ncbi:tail protein [Lysinibacillus phage vB_LspM-01]|nr:tail protein [Lysinibacillus phage vB_LspM-01]
MWKCSISCLDSEGSSIKEGDVFEPGYDSENENYVGLVNVNDNKNIFIHYLRFILCFERVK